MLKLFLLLILATKNSFALSLNQIIQNYVSKESFRGSILITRGTQTLFKNAYGLASEENSIPNRLQTRYRIGSLTKQFTAAAILKLQEQGKLKISNPLGHYIKVPKHWREIKVHHLLNHTAALKRDIPLITGKKGAIYHTPKQLVKSIMQQPLREGKKPGEEYHYSNAGYTVLAFLISTLTNEHYIHYLEKSFFHPLQLHHTGSIGESTPESPAEHAHGYVFHNQKLYKSCCWSIQNLIGAGDLYSSIEDLSNWFQALQSGKVLATKSTKLLFKPHIRMLADQEMSYAYGWVVQNAHERSLIWHNGRVDGFTSMMVWYPKQNITIVILSNQSFGPRRYLLKKLSHELLDVLTRKTKAKAIRVANKN